jgi:aquaporin Z
VLSALLTEPCLTFGFLIVILGSTDARAPKGFAPIAIGLALTLIHLISNPGHEHVGESGAFDRPRNIHGWLGSRSNSGSSWVAPILGALVAGYAYRARGRAGRRSRAGTCRDAQMKEPSTACSR